MISQRMTDMYFLTKLLEYYNMNINDHDERNSPWSFNSLTTPFNLNDFVSVIDRIEQAISNDEKTVIYGDYDVDGLTSVAILKSALDKRGLNPGFYIPSRYVDGYGLNVNRVQQFYEKGYHLIITVDNGICCNEAISLAKHYGMDVIVIDHHEESDVKPDYDFCFHQIKSGFLKYNCSAASLCFFVASKLLSKFDAYYATLAGIAVFSDVMPLVGNNLELAKMMLYFINKYKYDNLCQLLGIGNITYHDISFNLIPSLNSVGRICKQPIYNNNLCKFLFIDDTKFIKDTALFIKSKNAERKEIVSKVKFNEKYTLESDHGICLMTDDYSGLSGLFANKILKEKNKPVAIFSNSDIDDDQFIASIRVPDNYSLDEFLSSIKGTIVTGGGHKKACGITIYKKDYYLICTQFISSMSKQSLDLKDVTIKTIDITLDDLNAINYQCLETFMPFGEGFNEPIFRLIVDKEGFVIVSDKFAYKTNDKDGKVIVFNNSSILKDTRYSHFEILGNFSLDSFKEKKTYTLVSKKIIPYE